MANTNAPFGLRPVRHYFGGVIRPSEYSIADAYGTALMYGDPVVCTGTGKNVQRATGADSAKITGVFAGCEYVAADGEVKFSESWVAGTAVKAGTKVKALVLDDPNILFEIQMDTLAEADVRLCTNLVIAAGDAVTGRSGCYASGVAGTENQLKIMGLSGVAQIGGAPNAYGAYAIAEVLINFHELRSNVMTEI